MRTFQTTLGAVPVWGDFDRFDPSRPLVLVVRGAFARLDQYAGLTRYLPEVDMAFMQLPGMHSPHIAAPSVQRFAAALDEAAALAFGKRPFAKVGVSIGGLVAMAMKTGEATLALDPPISTATAWPVLQRVRSLLREEGETPLRAWCWNVLGMSETGVENRDYRPIVEGARRPLTVMIAGLPLEPERPISASPGLINADDRDWLRALPGVRSVTVSNVGHNLAEGAGTALVDYIRKTAERAVTPA